MATIIQKAFGLFFIVTLVQAQSSTMSMSMPAVMSGIPMTTDMAMSTAANVSAAQYTITAPPAVQSQPSCVFNCLIPIGMADPSGCDDVTNECACLNAPMDALDVLTGCIETVCLSSTSTYAAAATSLYQSYCQSVFGSAEFSQAFSIEASEAAASASATSNESMTTTAAPRATIKSESASHTPSL